MSVAHGCENDIKHACGQSARPIFLYIKGQENDNLIKQTILNYQAKDI